MARVARLVISSLPHHIHPALAPRDEAFITALDTPPNACVKRSAAPRQRRPHMTVH
jgi:hypothetical protein